MEQKEMITREEVEQTARELTDSYDIAVGKSTMKFYRHREDKVRPKAASMLRSLLAKRNEAIEELAFWKDRLVAPKCGQFRDDFPGARAECSRRQRDNNLCSPCPDSYRKWMEG